MSDDVIEVTPKRKEDFYCKVQKRMIDAIRQGHIYLNHAPKAEKYGLCQQIRNTEYELYALLIEAKKRYWNKTTLTKLDVKHEQLRGLWRLFYELGYFDYHHESQMYNEQKAIRRFTAINVIINELGAMIGGIIKTAKQSDAFN